ncbi:virulence factor, partial [Salmonella enterica subsp. enterica serovar Johannesburg]
MYAISFDLVVADTAQNHPKGISQAYADIFCPLRTFALPGARGSLYTYHAAQMATLFSASRSLNPLPCAPSSGRAIRAM